MSALSVNLGRFGGSASTVGVLGRRAGWLAAEAGLLTELAGLDSPGHSCNGTQPLPLCYRNCTFT